MRLAEALILRADRQKRIEQLKQRLLQNARVQEGDDPAEDPQDLISEFDRVADELARLVQRINETNTATPIEGYANVTAALAARDVFGLRHAVYRELAQAASVTQSRYTRSEVRYRSTINVAETQRRADALAQQYRDLDSRIQETNWTTDLIE